MLSTTGFTGFQFARNSLPMFDQNQWSQDFQAIGDVGRVKSVAGALYYREHVVLGRKRRLVSPYKSPARRSRRSSGCLGPDRRRRA